jgi:hypothetical protein
MCKTLMRCLFVFICWIYICELQTNCKKGYDTIYIFYIPLFVSKLFFRRKFFTRELNLVYSFVYMRFY